MKKILKWLFMILVLLVGSYGLYMLITEGIISFKTRNLAGIVFIVCIVIYFVFKVIRDVRKNSKNVEDE